METIDESIEEELGRLLEVPKAAPELTADWMKAPISSLAIGPVVAVPLTGSVRDAVDRMKSHRTGAVLVTDADGRLAGIFTERDLLLRVIDPQRDWRQVPIAEYMTANPETLKRNDKIAYALNFMHIGGYRNVPIVDDDHRPVGIVSTRHVVAWLAELFFEEVCNLPPDPEHPEPTSRYGG